MKKTSNTKISSTMTSPPHAPQKCHNCTSKLNINNNYSHLVNDSNHPIPRPFASSTPAATSS
jgi:hypothetical protein